METTKTHTKLLFSMYSRRRTVRSVRGQFDSVLIDDVVERRPTATRIEFCFGREQRFIAHHTRVQARLGCFVVLAGERPVGTHKRGVSSITSVATHRTYPRTSGA